MITFGRWPNETMEHAQPLTAASPKTRRSSATVSGSSPTAQIRPLVREMDEHAKIPRALVDQLFDLGVMGIEIPEAYGGAGASFFHAVLAVEELSRVDPSVGVLVDVQNTLVVNALLRWGNDDIKRRYLPSWPPTRSARTRSRKRARAAMPSR